MALSLSIPLLNSYPEAYIRYRATGKAKSHQCDVEVTIFMKNINPELTFADIL